MTARAIRAAMLPMEDVGRLTGDATDSPQQKRRRLMVLGVAGVLLAAVCVPLARSTQAGIPGFHATIECVGALLGLVAGLAMIGRFYALGNRFYLFIGLAFFANATADFVHGLMCFEAIDSAMGMSTAALARFIPGSYVAGRLLMGVLLLAAPFALRWFPESGRPKRETVMTSAIVICLTFVAIALACFIPLPEFVFPEYAIPRPVDFFSAAVLVAALLALLWKYHRDSDTLTWWIVLSVMVNVIGQLAMSFSKVLYDPLFDVSHVYKVLGYAVPLLGFCLCQIGVVSGQRRVQQELRDYAEALQAANQALERSAIAAAAATRTKSEFLANMSHEIRTPITAVLGFADLLLEECAGHPSALEQLAIIKRNGEHLLQVINDILDISKIEGGQLTVEHVPCAPAQILADVKTLMQVRAEAKGLTLDVQCVGPLPQTIHTDPTRLRQVLINLIGNALKFTEAGGVRLTAQLVDGNDPLLQFDVVDTGVGMTALQAARIFQPFAQADASTARRFGGSGLGLVISKRLAEMLGGDVVLVDSRMGGGSRFRASVATGPLGELRTEDISSAVSSVHPVETPPCGTAPLPLRCRVLLAEDGPDNQRLIVHFLKKGGTEVVVVENGQLALDAAMAARDEARPFHAILMDMQMPVLDGYEATRRLRAAGYAGPIIALTAHAMKEDRQKCLDAGCNDYLSKPIDRQTLLSAVAKHVVENVFAGPTCPVPSPSGRGLG